MGRDWVDHPSWEVVTEAEDWTGRDVTHLLLEADAEELRQTRNSQLVTFVGSMMVLDALKTAGATAHVFAGHSLGEYSALVAAGVMDRGHGVRLVAERGEAMQTAANTTDGTMAAVLGLDEDQVELACQITDGDVWVANYNAPGQVVIAGSPDAIEAAGLKAKDLGAKRVMPIKVGGAFHTPFMSPARDRLRKALADVDFGDATGPVYANVDARPHSDGSEWAGLLGAQLTSPVRWRQTLNALDASGATVYLEIGPGTVLTGLAKRTVKGCDAVGVTSPSQIEAILATISAAADADAGPEGEILTADERLIVSPATGVFQPVADVLAGARVNVGQLLGRVGSQEVRSNFTGHVQGFLAHAGERVTAAQPVAWVQTRIRHPRDLIGSIHVGHHDSDEPQSPDPQGDQDQ